MGIECVGIIEETTAENLNVGQQMISIMGEIGRDFDGGYAEYTLIPNHQIYPVITKRLDLDSLIALPETYYTVFGAYKNLKIHCNDRILVRAATSGVGAAFTKLIKGEFPNIYLVGTTRNLSKKQELLGRGFSEVILENDGILHTNQTFTKILDLVGPSVMKDSISHLAEDGIICSCGQLGG